MSRLLLLTTLPLLTVAARAEGQVTGQDLFAPLADTAVQPLRAETVRQRLVTIDLGRLHRARNASLGSVRRDAAPPQGAALRLNLFDDVLLTGVVEHTAPTLSGGYSLWGRIVGEPLGDVVLVVNGDTVAGSVVTREGTYRIESAAGGTVVSEVEESPLDCQMLAPPSTERGVGGRSGHDPNGLVHLGRTPSVVSGRNSDQEVSTVDLAVFWTPAAGRGRSILQMNTSVERLVAAANAAFRASGALVRVELVAAEEVDYREVSRHVDLFRFHETGDGHMNEVHDVRSRASADVMMLILNGTGGGSAVVGGGARDAFAVVEGVDRTLTFVHELGHVVGQLVHDRYAHLCARSPCLGSNYGYVNKRGLDPEAPASAVWRTVMSVDSRCQDAGIWCGRLPRFSNPDLVYPDPGGDAMGVPVESSETGLEGPADSVRSINARRATVADFYRAPAIEMSFGASTYTATEGGDAATVTVTLSDEPTRRISIPLVVSGAPAREYEVPSMVVFGADETSRTLTLTAVDDAIAEEDESVVLAFGESLARGVTAAGATTVTLKDNDPSSGPLAVHSLYVSTAPQPSGWYSLGDRIEATARFNKYVTVTATPRLGLTVGDATRWATYMDTADEDVRFGYVVTGDDFDLGGVSIAADRLDLNGGTIRDAAAQNAVLTHAAVEDDAGARVDGVRPSVQSAFVRGEDLTLTFNEDLETKSSPGADAFTVTEDGRGVFVWNVDVAGRQVSVRLDPPAVEGQSVTVAYAGWSRRVLDLAGNPAAGFSLSGAEVENASPAIVYDADRDGWIDISDLAQLDAIRHDLDGDGAPSSGESAEYFRAFPGSADRIYCYGGCEGYELVQDLDFDTDGSGRPGAGDAYWNGGAGWEPISEFGGLFRGNGHTISNLFIDRSGWHVGLFGRAGRWSEIEEVGLIAVDVRGRVSVGALVGFNDGSVRSSFATGRVAGDDEVGGLVGLNQGAVSDSYATGTVTHTGRGTDAGALFGVSYVRVRNSYATGPVISSDGGGLGEISSSLISASYWDRTTSGRDGGRDGGRSTFDLQAPTGSVGIYAAWSGDVWDFDSGEHGPMARGADRVLHRLPSGRGHRRGTGGEHCREPVRRLCCERR